MGDGAKHEGGCEGVGYIGENWRGVAAGVVCGRARGVVGVVDVDVVERVGGV